MTDEVLTTDIAPEERPYEETLRPRRLTEFVGQERLKTNLGVFIGAARDRSEALDHALFFGAPGLGKTTLAHIVATEMDAQIHFTSGPVLERPVSGSELAARLAAHLRKWGLEVRRLAVRRIERAAGGFLVETDGGAVLAGAQAHRLLLLPERGFLPDLEAIPTDIARRAKMLWLNYPNNPTSAMADLSFFEQAVAFARKNDILICHDAPYCEVTYDGYTAPSILQVPGASEVTVEFNSLSKTYNMAGWRVGMAVGNSDVLTSLFRVKSNVDSGQFLPVQEAAVRALETPQEWIEERNGIYQTRRKIALAGLAALGWDVVASPATLYLWAQIPAGQDSEGLATKLLNEAGVSVAPGSFFGDAGEGYVRISITSPKERIAEAMERLSHLKL